jgi:galactokinase/mevalonate kinase-like predicted kinase
LAGGWSDTPPYCQLHGGSVVNLATNLNGQPPLQAFVKRAERPVIVLRSIDLGVETTLRSYDDIGNYAKVGNEFSIAKAALALAGFQPHFCKTAFKTLQEQLRYMGGGLEVSFVAAVPKGSGLGTSSILAATILGALNDFCALNWDINALCNRVLVLEQMLTSGGGWQDQFGGALHGMKLLETKAGIDQTPTTKWLPEHLLQEGIDNNSVLLYYTGITRVAKGILQEIVRGMFLNDNERLRVLGEIRDHAATTYDIIQRANWEGLAKAVGRSWQLNQQLDKGTNPEPVQALFSQIDDYLAGAKLLGAGGGGYLLMIAKDADAAHRVKAELQQNPPNPGARFVDIQISHTGLQVTRS